MQNMIFPAIIAPFYQVLIIRDAEGVVPYIFLCNYNPSTIVPMVPLPNNGVPDEPVRWGNSTREACGDGFFISVFR